MDVDVETDVANGRLLAYLAQHGEILSRTYTGERVSIHCRLPRKYVGRIRPDDAVIRPRITVVHRNGNGNGNGHSNGNGVLHTNGAGHHNGDSVGGPGLPLPRFSTEHGLSTPQC